ncbi:asparaginase [Pontivivens ytuae]|uniref:Asparaginase n=1 Tax=Pontivivens ytuae TaxID=2789856 RepID=A0A7S9QF94_9RHOB|nr:asparaginase [Pontivivens ytuae]QPH56016.1 asparaginase [Pontivivens ytuae]
MAEHKTLLISTGGTIAGEVASSKKMEGFQVKRAGEFQEILSDTITYLEETAKIDLTIDAVAPIEVDSSNINPAHWQQLVDIVKEKYDEYDSFVITHGTNTLGYTCAALSFAIENPGKPIVLTGSQVPMGQPGSDAKSNLENAFRVATWTRDPIYGVVAVFGSHIITGTRVKKDTEFDYDAFKTFNAGSLGRIGRIIDINKPNLDRHNRYKEDQFDLRLARSSKSLQITNEFDTNIISLTEFPGMDPAIMRTLVERHQVSGFIIRAFGAGDLSETFIETLNFLKTSRVPVVVTTQAPNGNATLQVNEPGQYLAEHKLVIPAYDMSHESQVAKLSWLLPRVKRGDIQFEQLPKEMMRDYRGEIQVIHEEDIGELI